MDFRQPIASISLAAADIQSVIRSNWEGILSLKLVADRWPNHPYRTCLHVFLSDVGCYDSKDRKKSL